MADTIMKGFNKCLAYLFLLNRQYLQMPEIATGKHCRQIYAATFSLQVIQFDFR